MNSTLTAPSSIRFRWQIGLAIGFFAALWLAGVARGDEGIVVTGSGVATARPTLVEFYGTLSAEAELTADATVKFRDARKRGLAALAALKNPQLSIVSGGTSIENALDQNAMMMQMRGMAVAPSKSRIRLLQSSRITLRNADQLAPEALLDNVLKIVETAKDAGFQVGSAPPSTYYEMMNQMNGNNQQEGVVVFEFPDSDALREKASAAALAEARRKARNLAELAGVKLGPILSVTEQSLESGGAERIGISTNYYGSSNRRDAGVSCGNSGELALRVVLGVRFAIGK